MKLKSSPQAQQTPPLTSKHFHAEGILFASFAVAVMTQMDFSDDDMIMNDDNNNQKLNNKKIKMSKALEIIIFFLSPRIRASVSDPLLVKKLHVHARKWLMFRMFLSPGVDRQDVVMELGK